MNPNAATANSLTLSEQNRRLAHFEMLLNYFSDLRTCPAEVCWLTYEKQGRVCDHFIYCKACAERVRAWSTGSAPKEYLEQALPRSVRDVRIVIDRGEYEADGSESCMLCRKRLSVSLTEYGALKEIEYFEQLEPHEFGSRAYWDLLGLVVALRYSHRNYEMNERCLGVLQRHFTQEQEVVQ